MLFWGCQGSVLTVSIVNPSFLREPLWLVWIVFVFGGTTYCHYVFMGEVMLPCVVMYDDYLKWTCIGYRSVIMYYTDIRYVGIATYDGKDEKSLLYSQDEVLNHCFSTIIYISNDLFPSHYLHQIHKLHSRTGFVKFPYSIKFAETLLSKVPSANAANLRFFHNTVLLADKKDGKKKLHRK
jgi:hypothetical protein